MLITEDLLHYLWKFRLFERAALQTTAGEEIEVFSAGMAHTDGGPDFQNARIRIGETTWAGNVELHVNSADWQRHGHQTDVAYSSVILHVVYKDDSPVILPDGRKLPTLELHNRIPEELYQRYHHLIFSNQQFIPCEGSINQIDEMNMRNWLTRVLVERLEKKSGAVIDALNVNRGDWEEIFYRFLAANFGFKVNALPFELMAKSLPQIILSKHKNYPLQIEALIFGQAGFLEDHFTDEYPRKLKEEYNFLRKKHNLTPIEKHLWKFLRMRPQSFPTIRLAQFAALVVNSNHLFSKILDLKEVAALRNLFAGSKVNEYWDIHYRFDAESKPAPKNMGAAAVDILLLNTVAVFLFSYGTHLKKQYYISRALQLLEYLPAEKNHITDDFVNLGVKITSAFESQALLELKNFYCNHKKCLQCAIGNKILKLT
jgi:predicted kinase